MKCEQSTPEPETVIRAFELPLQHADKDVLAILGRCWDEAAMLANWLVQQMQRADVMRLPDMEKLPKFTPPDFYAMIRGREQEKVGSKDKTKILPITPSVYPGADFFNGGTTSLPAIIKKVVDKYQSERLQVFWYRQTHFSTYATVPWPVPAKSWLDATLDVSGKPCVRVSIPGGQVTLNLRGGPEFGRQMAQFREVVNAKKEMAAAWTGRKELVIRWQHCSESSHRPVCWYHGRPGRVMIKMVAEMPVREKPGDRCLVLTTDPNSFWVADLDQRPAWILNNDNFRRNVAMHLEHLRRLERLREDGKAERRLRNNRVQHLQPRIEAMCEQDRQRMDSSTHEATANLVNFAIRQRVGEVYYLDRNKKFMPSFPWYQLHQKLADKCKANGIAFYSESAMLSSDGGSEELSTDDTTGEVDIQPTEENDKWLRVDRLREMAGRKLIASLRRSGSHPAVTAP